MAKKMGKPFVGNQMALLKTRIKLGYEDITILVIIITINVLFGHVCIMSQLFCKFFFILKKNFSFGFHPRRAIYVPLITNVTKINDNLTK
jgi:hypothetical protein